MLMHFSLFLSLANCESLEGRILIWTLKVSGCCWWSSPTIGEMMKVLKDTVENWFPLSFSLLGLNWAMSRANRRVPLFRPHWAGLVAPADMPHRGRLLLSQGPCPSLESSSSPAATPRWAPINVIRFRSWSIWISQILLPNSRIKAVVILTTAKILQSSAVSGGGLIIAHPLYSFLSPAVCFLVLMQPCWRDLVCFIWKWDFEETLWNAIMRSMVFCSPGLSNLVSSSSVESKSLLAWYPVFKKAAKSHRFKKDWCCLRRVIL